MERTARVDAQDHCAARPGAGRQQRDVDVHAHRHGRAFAAVGGGAHRRALRQRLPQRILQRRAGLRIGRVLAAQHGTLCVGQEHAVGVVGVPELDRARQQALGGRSVALVLPAQEQIAEFGAVDEEFGQHRLAPGPVLGLAHAQRRDRLHAPTGLGAAELEVLHDVPHEQARGQDADGDGGDQPVPPRFGEPGHPPGD